MLQTEIALHKKKLLATTVQAPGLTLEAMTLQRESTIWPEPMLLEDPLHAFEPTRHVGGVMFRIVKLMGGTVHNMSRMHFGAILVMCPSVSELVAGAIGVRWGSDVGFSSCTAPTY